MLQILIFKPTLEFTVVEIILDNLINRLIWNEVVEVNLLSLDEWTIIVYLCDEINKLIRSGVAPLDFWEAHVSLHPRYLWKYALVGHYRLFFCIFISWKAKHFCQKKCYMRIKVKILRTKLLIAGIKLNEQKY